jgi:hypothetical protein
MGSLQHPEEACSMNPSRLLVQSTLREIYIKARNPAARIA